jgi:hypothetical protein
MLSEKASGAFEVENWMAGFPRWTKAEVGASANAGLTGGKTTR